MDKFKLLGLIRSNKMTCSDLAKEMHITNATFSTKINEKRGSEFKRAEIKHIIDRFALTADQVMDIFFTDISS